jgi:precorrin-6B methylase 2
MPTDPTARFSNRVDDYVRYRPSYPAGVLEILRAEAGLTPATIIADVGAGTGISAELFLRNGNTVYAVEPNDAMRLAAERLLHGYPNFHSVRTDAPRRPRSPMPRSI